MPEEYWSDMVEAVQGLEDVDIPILRFVHRHDGIEDGGFEFDPFVVGKNIDVDNDYVSKRARRLEAAGIFERMGRGHYRLTDLGRRLCSNDLSEREIEQIEADLKSFDQPT